MIVHLRISLDKIRGNQILFCPWILNIYSQQHRAAGCKYWLVDSEIKCSHHFACCKMNVSSKSNLWKNKKKITTTMRSRPRSANFKREWHPWRRRARYQRRTSQIPRQTICARLLRYHGQTRRHVTRPQTFFHVIGQFPLDLRSHQNEESVLSSPFQHQR